MDTTSKALSKHTPISASTRPPRRLRPLAEKRAIVEETLEPGASVAVVARRHEVNANLVFGWRKLYRAGLLTATDDAVAPLVPVRMKRSAKAAQPARRSGPSPLAIDIELSKGRVRVHGDIDLRIVRALIEALA